MTTNSSLSAGRPSSRKPDAAKTLYSLRDDVETEKARLNIEIPKSKHTALKIYAASQGKTIKELMIEHIDNLLR